MNDYEKSVYEKFSSENWTNATYDERMAALQELAVISSTHNNNSPSLVRAEYIEGTEFGYYDGNSITVNRYVLESGMFFYHDEKTGELKSETMDDAHIQMVDTIFHEDFHSFQDACIRGEIPQETLDEMGITQEQIQDWAANNAAGNYIEYDDDIYDLYRIQSLEKAAFEAGEKNTKEVFAYLNEKYGEDPAFQEYLKAINENGYDVALNSAKDRYKDPNIERTIQDEMNARYAEIINKANIQNTNNANAVNKANQENNPNAPNKANEEKDPNAPGKSGPGLEDAEGLGAGGTAESGMKDTDEQDHTSIVDTSEMEDAGQSEDDGHSSEDSNDSGEDNGSGGGGNNDDSGMDMD
ncbi:MAG: hypothetical protein LUG93_14725 [Lachnospiraceae bacterium]|nr:hypothetical protein [Lachnospiraceae bacterium]